MKEIKSLPFFDKIRLFLTEHMPLYRHHSKHTIRSYKNALNLLIEYFKSQNTNLLEINFDMITEIEIRNFLKWLETEKNCKNSTINCRLAAIKVFCKYVASRDVTFQSNYLKINLIENLPEEKDTVSFLEESDIELLLSLPDKSTKKGRRDALLLLILYTTAAREEELIKLTMQSFLTTDGGITVKLHGKGNKTRVVPLDDNIYSEILNYVKDFDIEYSDPLFNSIIHGSKKQLSASSVYKIVKRYGELLSTKSSTAPKILFPHMLRHSRAMFWYRHGIGLDIIAQLLGHSHVETTQIYSKADTDMKRRALAAVKESSDPVNSNHEILEMADEELLLKLAALR